MKTSRFGRIDRRRLVASAIGGAAVLTSGQLLPARARARQPAMLLTQDDSSNVPMYRGNPARTGVMPGPGPDDANGVEVLWRFTANNDPLVTRIASSPAVVDSVVYVASGWSLCAVNAENGTEHWRLTTDVANPSSPAVVDGAMYIGKGELYALNADDGTERWRFATDSEIASSPAVVDGVVYVGSRDQNYYAVSAEDGTERWRFATGDAPISSSPAAVGGVVYVGSADGKFHAIGARAPRLSAGGTARVMEPTSLRGGPAPTAVERVGLEPDTVVAIIGEAVLTGDVEWWPVKVEETGDQGWVDASKLESLTSGPEPTATP